MPLILCVLLAAILTANASALVIKLGPVREQTIRWLMESKHLSRPAAEQMMRDFARRNRADIIDEYEIPDGAIADFISIDPTKHGQGRVQREGCAMLFAPGSDYGKWYWSQLQKLKGTPNYDHFMKQFGAAVKAGVFTHRLTDEQRDRLMNGGRDVAMGPPPDVRVLVVSVRMPPWSDQANSTS
jgi:hypothetical protein